MVIATYIQKMQAYFKKGDFSRAYRQVQKYRNKEGNLDQEVWEPLVQVPFS